MPIFLSPVHSKKILLFAICKSFYKKLNSFLKLRFDKKRYGNELCMLTMSVCVYFWHDISGLPWFNVYREMEKFEHLLHDKLCFINDKMDLLSRVTSWEVKHVLPT